MDYRRPEVQVVGDAVTVVTQLSNPKALSTTDGQPGRIHSVPAYDLDE